MELKKVLKLWYYRFKYIKRKVSLYKGCEIGYNTTFEGCNVIGKNSQFVGSLGYGSYITENSIIKGHIGKYCSIASGVNVLSGTHPLHDFVSTSPVFYSFQKQNNNTFVNELYFDEFLYADKINKYVIIVGNDVWIGTNAIINGGITIGDGAVILANATVTKNVPPYTIVGGVPAKVLRKRFDDETINFLLEIEWWNQSPEWLRKNAFLFHDIIQFKENYKNK